MKYFKDKRNIFMQSYVMMCHLDLILLALRWKTDTLNITHCVLLRCHNKVCKGWNSGGQMDFLASLYLHHRNFVSKNSNKMPDISQKIFPLINMVTC